MNAVIILAALLLASAAPAHADPYVWSWSAGLGPMTGRITWDGPGELDPAELHLAQGFVGGACALHVSLGRRVSARHDVELRIGGYYDGGHGRLGHTGFASGLELDGTLDIGVHTQRRLVWRVGAGAGVAQFGGGNEGIESNDNVVEFERLVGPVAHASVRWDRGGKADIMFDLRAAYFVADHLRCVPVLLTFNLLWGTD